MRKSDDEDIEKVLKEYLVPYPSDDEIEKTVTLCEKYVKPKKVVNLERRKRILYNTYLGFKFFPKTFYFLSILIYVLGYINTVRTDYIYFMFMFVAPIPLMLSFINVFQGNNDNVWEVECTCKYLPQELAVSKILIVSTFNTLLNVALSIVLFETIPNLIFWKVTMLWLVPMVLTGAISLFVCSKVKSNYAVPGTLASWSVMAAGVSYTFSKINMFDYINLCKCVVLLIVGAVILFFALRRLTEHYSLERGTDYGIDNKKPFKTI